MIGEQTCAACEKHERFQHDQAKKNEKRIKAGEFVPQGSRLHRVYTRDEARQIAAAEQAALEQAQQWAADQVAHSLTQQQE